MKTYRGISLVSIVLSLAGIGVWLCLSSSRMALAAPEGAPRFQGGGENQLMDMRMRLARRDVHTTQGEADVVLEVRTLDGSARFIEFMQNSIQLNQASLPHIRSVEIQSSCFDGLYTGPNSGWNPNNGMWEFFSGEPYLFPLAPVALGGPGPDDWHPVIKATVHFTPTTDEQMALVQWYGYTPHYSVTALKADYSGVETIHHAELDTASFSLEQRSVDTRLTLGGLSFSGDEGWLTVTVELLANETIPITGINDAIQVNPPLNDQIIDVQFRNQYFPSPAYQPTEDYQSHWGQGPNGRIRYIYNGLEGPWSILPEGEWTKAVDCVIHFVQSYGVSSFDWWDSIPYWYATDDFNFAVSGLRLPVPIELTSVPLSANPEYRLYMPIMVRSENGSLATPGSFQNWVENSRKWHMNGR